MKILKKAGIGLLILLGILLLVSVMLPSDIHVERSVNINAPVKTVYGTVNNLRTWINWSYWDQIDPDMKSTFEGPGSGVGAVHKWTSNHEKVGTGTMTITGNAENERVLTSLEFGNMPPTQGGWLFEESAEGVKTTIFMDLHLPVYTRIMGLFMDKMLGGDFEKTLRGLKDYTESLPADTASPGSWAVETIHTTPAMVMSVKVVTNMESFTAKLDESYSKIFAAMKEQNLKQTGPMYAIYYKWTPDTIEMEPGIIVDKAGENSGDVIASELKPVKAIKVDYYGDPNTEKVHYFIDEWAKNNNVIISGPPWEEYVTDRMTEPDTAKWLTRVCYPVN